MSDTLTKVEPLSAEQAAALDRDGYLLLRGAVPEAWRGALRDAFDAATEHPTNGPRRVGHGWRHALVDLDPTVQRTCRLPACWRTAARLTRRAVLPQPGRGPRASAGAGCQPLHRDGAGREGRAPPPSRCVSASRHLPRFTGEEEAISLLPRLRGRWRGADRRRDGGGAVATAHAAIQAGLVPWFVDVDPVTGVLDADHVRERLTHAPGPVSAIVPVAAFGQPLDPAPWAKLAEDTGLPVVIDAAASFDSVSAAPIPTMVSLHATKSLGIGEGGFIASEDAGFIDRFRALTSFGFMGDREARFAANNAKLSEYTCAVGMAALDQWPSTRTAYATTAQRLRMALLHTPSVVFQPGWGLDWVSSTCVVELPEGATSAVEVALKAQGVDSRRWWGNGCHRAPAFAHYPADALPASERFAASTLGLPYFADMDIDQVNRVALALAEALA
jgi:dTDP-4-amino-4,6-dideoxygalactose transaminase